MLLDATTKTTFKMSLWTAAIENKVFSSYVILISIPDIQYSMGK